MNAQLTARLLKEATKILAAETEKPTSRNVTRAYWLLIKAAAHMPNISDNTGKADDKNNLHSG